MADKPNIIFILADDMGFGDVGCYNPDTKIPTPNMNKMAAEGIRNRCEVAAGQTWSMHANRRCLSDE